MQCTLVRAVYRNLLERNPNRSYLSCFPMNAKPDVFICYGIERIEEQGKYSLSILFNPKHELMSLSPLSILVGKLAHHSICRGELAEKVQDQLITVFSDIGDLLMRPEPDKVFVTRKELMNIYENHRL